MTWAGWMYERLKAAKKGDDDLLMEEMGRVPLLPIVDEVGARWNARMNGAVVDVLFEMPRAI